MDHAISHTIGHAPDNSDSAATAAPTVASTSTTTATATATAITPASTQEKTSRIVSEYLKGKDQQWKAIYERKGPLTLLELPVDVLRLIVKEITHTNDLTSLALTNSAFHNLAIPLIYSRFDIVWPDGQISTSESKSVDALTYGLSTLCLGNAFARTARRTFNPTAAGSLNTFAGNDYAKYTKKFSLGNGPEDWVNEYKITKESGKMLGTMVSLAVAKMKNLEAFVWDMPTGVLSDIFMALSSLGDQPDNNCKLSRVWIRWHENIEHLAGSSSSAIPIPMGGGAAAVVPLGSQLTPIGIMLPPNGTHPIPRPAYSYSENYCEYPTFSVLPPLKSLTVLDIDELAYLDEMAVLIERSKDTLQELRVGIAARSTHKDFVQTWDGAGLKQIDHAAKWPGESTIGERRLGGILGVLVGKVYDIRKRPLLSRVKDKITPDNSADPEPSTLPTTPIPTSPQAEGDHPATPTGGVPSSLQTTDVNADQTVSSEVSSQANLLKKPQSLSKEDQTGTVNGEARKRLEGKLKLQSLELERVPLSLQVCRNAIDWSTLTSLTLLDCAQHETLWKILRKQFQPTPLGPGYGISTSSSKPPPPNTPLQYHLALKQIHTDFTTPTLISFIKETLAPNTLEVLFLQDRTRPNQPYPLPLDMILKGPLKRHRLSLRKLLLDSSAKLPAQGSLIVGDSGRWRNWTLTTEVLTYITSGRMPNLKELAVSLDYKDWHTFLQRLPNVPQLRAINVPHIAEYINSTCDPIELAHQIADIITLRPEIRLCYIGIGVKCFEILEYRETSSGMGAAGFVDIVTNDDPNLLLNNHPGSSTTTAANGMNGGLNGEEQEDTSDEEDDDDDSEDDDNTPTTATSEPDETQSDGDNVGGGEEDDDDKDSFVELDKGRVKLRLREILFYDDKVAIFRARHGGAPYAQYCEKITTLRDNDMQIQHNLLR
ncbi:hypothetical protein B0T17DRAFT_593175 [Bombardia bombarda]|uniref:F-box domain-containing protein n=1 Tax=Bombardia bombarda TaxID=252184 RepID=A0AA39TIN0_9PEZI|nr:hypothetical protein B0T17DRAFT_593175 [Bombardia bombarda]